MKVNSYSVKGIFLETQQNNEKVLYEIGDIIIYQGTDTSVEFRVCTVDNSPWDYNNTDVFKGLKDNYLGLNDWELGGEGIITSATLKDILYTDKTGATNFLYNPIYTDTNNVKAFVGNIDEIRKSSTYYLGDGVIGTNLPIKPSANNKSILNTIKSYLGDDKYGIIQSLYHIQNNKINSIYFRYGQYDGQKFEWKDMNWHQAITSAYTSSYDDYYDTRSKISKIYNFIKNHKSQYKVTSLVRPSIGGDLIITEFGINMDSSNLSNNIMLEAVYDITINSQTRRCHKWIKIFSQDIIDSERFTIILEDNDYITMTLSNKIVSIETKEGKSTNAFIKSLVEYEGELSGDSYGTGYYQFTVG